LAVVGIVWIVVFAVVTWLVGLDHRDRADVARRLLGRRSPSPAPVR